MKTWNDYLQDFIIERLIELEECVLAKNQEYRAAEERLDRLFRRIMEEISPDNNLRVEYEDAQLSEMDLRNRIIYRQGLLDGLRFKCWVDKVQKNAR